MVARLQSYLRRTNPGLILALLLSLLAAWPFLLRPSLPRETDAELHVFRTAELGYALRAGELYPRWAADFYYGYGYPIFNYYAPLAYYLANLLSLAIPGGAVFGVKAVFVLGFLAAGGGTYALASDLTGPRAGMIAAASYLFAPYFYLIDPHLRGDLPEFLALSLAPLMFWSMARYQRTSTSSRLAVAASSIAAVILSHNLLALVFFGMAVAFAAWRVVTQAQTSEAGWLEWVRRAAAPLVLGVSLAAFFWLPVALEHNEVQLGNLIGPGHFDFRSHFLDLSEMFAPSIPLDLGAKNPAFRFNLGLGQGIIAVAGITALLVAVRTARGHDEGAGPLEQRQVVYLAFWPGSLLLLLFLMTRCSVQVWEALPLMAFIQFPWRLLGPASLCLAVTGSFSLSLLRDKRLSSRLSATAFVLLPLISTLPIWVPPGWSAFGPTDRLAMLEFEIEGLALGTTATGDFVPSTVDVVPAPNSDVIASYRQGGPIDRVNRYTLPDRATVEIVAQRPTSDVFAVRSDEPFVLRLYRFMFAGWHASIDGEPASIEVAEPEGFITIPVPAGSHIVRVWLGLTPARILASAISIGALIVLALLVRSKRCKPLEHKSARSLPEARWIAAALCVFALIAGLGSWAGMFQPQSSGLIAAPAEESIRVFVQGGIDLIGYTIPDREVAPGEELDVNLYWKAREPVLANYQVFVHLTSIPEHTWGQSDKLNPGDYPTARWPLDRYVLDAHSLTIPEGTPPGEYTVRVGLWDHQAGIRLLILAEDGTVQGDSIALEERITVLPADNPPEVDNLLLDVVLDEQLTPSLRLIGADIDPGLTFDAEMGRLTVLLYWRAQYAGPGPYNISVRLLDGTGAVVASHIGPPADGIYPMSQWRAGDVIRDVHSLWIDPSIPAGEYQLETGLAVPEQAEPDRWTPLGHIVRRLP